MTTILGSHIRLIRPEKQPQPKVYKDERPVAKYDKRPKTRKLGMAEFFKICLEWEDNLPKPTA